MGRLRPEKLNKLTKVTELLLFTTLPSLACWMEAGTSYLREKSRLRWVKAAAGSRGAPERRKTSCLRFTKSLPSLRTEAVCRFANYKEAAGGVPVVFLPSPGRLAVCECPSQATPVTS